MDYHQPLSEDMITKELANTAKYKGEMWAIFVHGDMVALTKVRVYKQKSRAYSELVRHFRYRRGPDPTKYIERDDLKKMIDDLIDNGIIEIKLI